MRWEYQCSVTFTCDLLVVGPVRTHRGSYSYTNFCGPGNTQDRPSRSRSRQFSQLCPSRASVKFTVMPAPRKTGTMARFGVMSGSYVPQLMKIRSTGAVGRARYRFTNFTTGSKYGPPPWSRPMSVKTREADCSRSDPNMPG